MNYPNRLNFQNYCQKDPKGTECTKKSTNSDAFHCSRFLKKSIRNIRTNLQQPMDKQTMRSAETFVKCKKKNDNVYAFLLGTVSTSLVGSISAVYSLRKRTSLPCKIWKITTFWGSTYKYNQHAPRKWFVCLVSPLRRCFLSRSDVSLSFSIHVHLVQLQRGP